MAGNIVIRVTGDSSQFTGFLNAVVNQVNQASRMMSGSFRSSFESAFNLKSWTNITPTGLTNAAGFPMFRIQQMGTSVRRLRTEMDQLNNVFKITGQIGMHSRWGWIPLKEETIFRGDPAEFVKALKLREAALNDLADANKRYAAEVQKLDRRTQPAIAARDIAQQDLKRAKDYLKNLKTTRREIAEELTGRAHYRAGMVGTGRLAGPALAAFDRTTNKLMAERATNLRDIRAATRDVTTATTAYNTTLADRRLTGYDRALGRIQRKFQDIRREIGARARADWQDFLGTGQVGVPAGYTTVQQMSPQLLSTLRTAGLGAGAKGSALGQALYGQQARFNAPVRDLVRDVTELSGSFVNNKGVLTRWSAEIDKSGKLVTRFGGHLSGLSNMSKMIVRDFQKVIEWAIATTVVYGGLRAAMEAVSKVKTLDASLARIGITAQLSHSQLMGLFDDLAQVAIDTATPLADIVGVADDIALATRKSTQNLEEWREEILNVTEAVGILTNITGMDAVKATDLLIASQKQLGYTSEDLIPLLSQITAAAGGQANAIADISQGLAVMAESGKQARMSVEQQIGVIQVLSQVTSKSPAEVATAFKNIVGSIDSPGSIRALKKFGIAVRDEAGNIRPFLEILAEVNQKLQEGVISQGQLKELIRGMAGGPRRAPDLAALLSNLPAIFATEEQAVNATNEALLANVQILDTINAKATQLQVLIDKEMFKALQPILKDLATSGLDMATALITGFKDLNPVVLEAVTKLSFLLAALGGFRIAGGVLKSIFGGLLVDLRGMVVGFSTLTGTIRQNWIVSSQYLATGKFTRAMFVANTLAAREYALALATVRQGFINLSLSQVVGGLKGLPGLSKGGLLKGGLLAGGAVGALGLASSGALGGGGSALQTIGMFSQLIPIPQVRLLGLALMGVGLAMDIFGQKTEETTTDMVDQSKEILALIRNINQLTSEKKAQEAIQADSIKTMELYADKTDLTKEDTMALVDAQNKYATSASIILSINASLSESFADLSKMMAVNADEYPDLMNLIEKARLGILDDAGRKKLIVEITRRILEKVSPQALPREGAGLIRLGPNVRTIPEKNQVGIPPEQAWLYLTSGTKQRLGEVTPPFLNQFMRTIASGGAAFHPGTLSEETLNLLEEKIKGTGSKKEIVDYQLEQLDAIRAQADGLAQINIYLEQQKALAFANQLIGETTATEYQNQIKYLDTIGTLYKQSLTLKDPKAALAVQKQVASIFIDPKTGSPYKDDFATRLKEHESELRSLAIALAVASGDNMAFVRSLKTAPIDVIVSRLGIAADAFKQTGDDADIAADKIEEYNKIVEQVSDSLGSFLGGAASASLSLEEQLASGDISKKQYNRQRGALDELIKGGPSLFTDLSAALATFNSEAQVAQDATTILGVALQDIKGLEDASVLSADQMISRLLGMGQAANLSAGQMIDLINNVSILIKNFQVLGQALTVLSSSPYMINITPNMNLRVFRGQLLGVGAALLGIGLATGNGDLISQAAAFLSAAKAVGAIQAALPKVRKYTASTVRGGRGGGGGGGGGAGGAGSRWDYGEIDLPEELSGLANRDALIRQAIRNARALQKKIPGAAKEGKNDIVTILDGMKKLETVRGIREDLLRRALEDLANIEKKRLEFETKADTIRRIRVGAGDFAAIANVPVNAATGVSMGGPNGPINVTLNLNGTLMTPAQFNEFANKVAAAIKRQLAK